MLTRIEEAADSACAGRSLSCVQLVEHKSTAATVRRKVDLPKNALSASFNLVIIRTFLVSICSPPRQLRHDGLKVHSYSFPEGCFRTTALAQTESAADPAPPSGTRIPECRTRRIDRILRPRLGELQVLMVEDVEEFRPKLQVHSLRNMESLEQREIPHLISGTMLCISPSTR